MSAPVPLPHPKQTASLEEPLMRVALTLRRVEYPEEKINRSMSGHSQGANANLRFEY